MSTGASREKSLQLVVSFLFFFFSLILTRHTGLGGTGHRAHDTFAPYFFDVSQRKMDIGNRGQGAEAKLKRKGKR